MTAIAGEIVLDTRLLEPPEPFTQAMETLQHMQPGQFLHMIHRREPRLLYPELAPRGFSAHTHRAAAQLFHILVWHQDDPLAIQHCQQLIQQLSANT